MKKEEEEEERGKVSQCYDVVMVAHTTRPINEPHPTLKKAYLDVTQSHPLCRAGHVWPTFCCHGSWLHTGGGVLTNQSLGFISSGNQTIQTGLQVLLEFGTHLKTL